MRVLVLGAGIAGVVTAYCLARRGAEVTVVEREDGVARATSFANGGVIGGTQIEPWAGPGLRLKILGWLGKEDAPLLVRWRQLPHMLGWGLRFLRHCDSHHFHQALETSGRLTRHSMAMFDLIRHEADIDPEAFGHVQKGALKLYLTEAAYLGAVREAEVIWSLGFDVRPVTPDECVSLEPGLEPAKETIAGGVHYVEEQCGDCFAFVTVLAERAEELGVTFRYGTEVRSLERSGDRITNVVTDRGALSADAVVVALASRSAKILATLGIRVPVIPIKGVTITVPAAPWKDAVRGAVMDHSRLFGLIRIGDKLRVSGSAEITGYDSVPSASRCEAILANVLELFPAFRACLDAGPEQRWAGLRGNTPDGPPILGPTPIANLFLDIGHGPQGWSTACGAADLVAAVTMGERPVIPLDGLTLERYGGHFQ